ncbi:MAG TPA: response regulator transcription factor [Oscillospiraceae bacterium]|nr:response regulator transcription factor [Oscillospiraceae bacterium]
MTNDRMQIFAVEDDDSITELIKATLDAFGYDTVAFENAEDALKSMADIVPDLAIFDIMLPGIDGISAVRLIRQDERLHKMPIILLTAKSGELDKVAGLDAGADDYLAKPFGVLELSARIRSLLRRSHDTKRERAQTITAAEITLNVSTREVTRGSNVIEFTLKEFELLRLLMENKGRVLTRDELLDEIWGYDFVGETRTLDMHIRSLRQKLNDDAENPIYIKTIRGVGYRFVG